MREQRLHLVGARLCTGHDAADGEPGGGGGVLPIDDAGLPHVGGHLDHGTDGPLGAHDRRDVVNRHAILQADDKPVFCQHGLDELARPARVVCLDEQKDDIEAVSKRRHVAQVEHGSERRDHGLFRHPDLDAVRTHRVDVGGPLFDEGDVEPGLHEVGTDSGALCAGSEEGDSW